MLRKQLLYLLVFSAQACFSQFVVEDHLAKLHGQAAEDYKKIRAIKAANQVCKKILALHKDGTIELTDLDKRWIQEQLQKQATKYKDLRVGIMLGRDSITFYEKQLEEVLHNPIPYSEHLRKQKQS